MANAKPVDPSDAARALAALPRRAHSGACPRCGGAFLSAGRRIYCSRACQRAAWEQTPAARHRAAAYRARKRAF